MDPEREDAPPRRWRPDQHFPREGAEGEEIIGRGAIGGQAETGQHRAASVDHHGGGTQRAMGEVAPMERREGAGDLAQHGRGLAERQRPPVHDPHGQRDTRWDRIDHPGPILEAPRRNGSRDGGVRQHQQLVRPPMQRLLGGTIGRRGMEDHPAGRPHRGIVVSSPGEEDAASASGGFFRVELGRRPQRETESDREGVAHVGLVVMTHRPR